VLYPEARFPRRGAWEQGALAYQKISKTVPIPGLWLGIDLALIKIKSALDAERVLKEKEDGAFDPEVLLVKGPVLLWGFWQLPKF
jgi:hypothetical protein